MSDEHNADEGAEKRAKTNSVNRRSFVKKLGVTGGVLAGAAGLSPTVKAKARNTTVNTLNSNAQTSVLKKALNEPGVETILQKFKQNGWTPNISEATAARTHSPSQKGADEVYNSLVLPFQTTDSTDIFITWVGLDNVGTHGYKLNPLQSGGWKNTVFSYSASTGSVSSNQLVVRADQPQVDGVVTPQHHLNPCPSGKSLNYSCVLRAAARYAAVIGACGSCVSVFPDPFACVTCASIIVNEYYEPPDCDICT